jgi:NAD dependent epimerase/dehydratase
MKHKKVLITGAAGFIGSHLTERLVRAGFQTRAFVHYNSRNSWGWLDHSECKSEIEVIAGDIRDFDSVFSAMKGCSSVFHLAALIAIPYSYISPLAYIKTNVEGTYNILESAKALNPDQVIITSTSETYGTAQYVPINETHPTKAQSPYSASKIAADQLTMSYFYSFRLPVKIIRPFNTYGPRQSARAIIPTIISQILSGNRQINLGNLAPTRDFTFVRDTVEGFLAIARCKKLFGEVTNIGMQEEISIGNLALLIAKLMKVDIQPAKEARRVRPRDSEVERLLCDNSKILRATHWKPKYSLKKGLQETIDWLRENLSTVKAGIYNY